MARIQNWLTAHITVFTAAVVSAGVILRLVGFYTAAFWFDEAYSVYLARLPLVQMVRAAMNDLTPPLNEIVLWPVVRFLGESELSARLPALIFSLVSIYLVYKLAGKFGFTPGQRLAALALVCLLPYQAWLAQDARIYSLFTMLYLAGILAALDRAWLGLAAICGLLLYSHASGIFYLPGLLLVGFLRNKKDLPRILLVGLAAAVSFVPWLPNYLHYASMNGQHDIFTFQKLANAIYFAFFAGTLNGILPSISLIIFTVSLLLAIYFSVKGFKASSGRPYIARPGLILAALSFLPLILMIIFGLAYKDVILYRTIGPLMIVLVLFMAWMLVPGKLPLATWTISAFWALLVIVGVASWTPSVKGGDMKDAALTVNLQLKPGDIIYYESAVTALPFSFYIDSQEQYIFSDQSDGLRIELQHLYGLKVARLENIPHQRAFIIIDDGPVGYDPKIVDYINGAVLVGVVHTWQISPIYIYLK